MGIIAHNAKHFALCCELFHNEILGKIGVLVLVDEHIAKLLLIALQHVGVVAQQQVGVKQQVVKVHGSRNATTLAIAGIDFCRERTTAIAIFGHNIGIAGIVCRRKHGIFHHREARLQCRWLVELFVELHAFHNLLDE
ncbi:Uncharacterised protein [Chlamydia trachomatis]|nr:Uncharacterised protein [Chlamydia trachomatis]